MATRLGNWWRMRGMTEARVAAVQPMTIMQSRRYRRFRQSSQERAVFFAKKLGLIRFTAGLMADSAARCPMVAEYQKRPGDPKSWEPVEDMLHAAILERFRNETEEPSDLVRLRTWHDQVAGECLLVKDVDDQGRAQFRIRSALTSDFGGDRILVREIKGGGTADGTARWYPVERVQRLWKPDEEEPLLASSATMGVLEDLERYWALHRRTKRRAESALAANGMLWMPGQAHQMLPHQQATPGGPAQPASKLERDYYAAAKRGLEDDDDLTSYVPLPVRWPHEYGPPQLIEFPTELDGIEFRREAIEDIARGLNYPQRLLVAGTGEGNHWSDWLMEEQFAKQSLAPILERIYWGDISNAYYRPALRALEARGWFADDPTRYRVGFDMTPVIVHPDQSARAVELYRLGLLGPDTVLDSNGFSEDDLPTDQEMKRFIETMQAIGQGGTPAPPGGNGGSIGGSATTGIDASNTRELPPGGAIAVATRARPFPAELVGWIDDD